MKKVIFTAMCLVFIGGAIAQQPSSSTDPCDMGCANKADKDEETNPDRTLERWNRILNECLEANGCKENEYEVMSLQLTN